MDTSKIRQKLLDLAIRGKLVPQDPADEPADKLLERIHAEKLDMVERGELKAKDVKGDTIIYIGSDGLPYEKGWDEDSDISTIDSGMLTVLPPGWGAIRLNNAYVFMNGTSKRRGTTGDPVPVLRLADLGERTISLNDARSVVLSESEREKYALEKDDLLFIRVNGSRDRVGDVFVVPDFAQQIAFCDHMIRGRGITCLDSKYVRIAMQSSDIQTHIANGIVCAAGQNTISQSVLGSAILPIPPLAEQRRIVKALDRYLALVEEIEQAQADLDVLFAQLKSKVLDLAIRGELAAQDPNDEPADKLLERIHAEKVAMVERGELKPKDIKGDTVIFTGSDGLRYEKPADGSGEARCIEDEIPFEVPQNWIWSRLSSLCSLLRRGKSPVYTDDRDIPVFAQKCNQPWGITLEKVKFLAPDALNKYGEDLKLKTDDVLVNSTGTGTLGRVGLFNEELLGDYPFIVPDSHVTVIRSCPGFYAKYIFYLLRSEYGQKMIFAKQTGSTNQKELPAKEVANFLVPLPPAAEQTRILNSIDHLYSTLTSL